MFNFYLNDTLVSDPVNWNEFSETIERDDTLKVLLPKYNIKLTFSKDGYDLLYGLYLQNGFCNLVNLKIDYKCEDCRNFENELTGYIFISDIRFNVSKCTCECQVIDNNYGAMIYNNKSVLAKVDAPFSKNGISITPATSTLMDFFDITNTLLFTFNAYPVTDVFRFLIDFMTDGNVGFESSYLTPANADQTAGWMYLVLGEELRLRNNTAFTLSFEQLFSEINKKYPIALTVKTSTSGKPIIRLENESFFYSETNYLTVNNIEELFLSTNTEKLYSSVKLGGQTAPFNPAIGSFPKIRFFSFDDEQYQLQGKCNIDSTLDLTGTFIADSNVIEMLTQTDTSNDQYDKDILFIESILGVGTFLSNDPTTFSNPFYYNANLTNNNVAERYLLANNIAFYLGTNADTFLAGHLSDTGLNSAYIAANTIDGDSSQIGLIYEDDSTFPDFNTTGSYNPSTGRYTSVADGVYVLEAKINFRLSHQPEPLINYDARFALFDASGTFVAIYGKTPASFLGPTNWSRNFTTTTSRAINIPLGYYVIPFLYLSAYLVAPPIAELTFQAGSYFKTLSVNNGGGVYQINSIGNYFVTKYEFNRALNFQDYKLLKSDLSQSVLINTDGNSNHRGWLRKVTRKYETSEMTWELVSNINSQQ